MGYLKHHTDFFARFGQVWVLVGGICCYCGIVFFEFLMPNTLIASLCRNWLENIRSIPNFALALCVFSFCLKRKPNSVKVVDWLARPAFSVYIIQAVPAVGMVLWPTLRERAPFSVDGSIGIAANLIVVPIGIYVVGGLVDGVRRIIFERWLLRCALVRMLDELLQRLYASVVNVPMAGIAGDECRGNARENRQFNIR